MDFENTVDRGSDVNFNYIFMGKLSQKKNTKQNKTNQDLISFTGPQAICPQRGRRMLPCRPEIQSMKIQLEFT